MSEGLLGDSDQETSFLMLFQTELFLFLEDECSEREDEELRALWFKQ